MAYPPDHDEDIAAFRKAMEGVQPLKPSQTGTATLRPKRVISAHTLKQPKPYLKNHDTTLLKDPSSLNTEEPNLICAQAWFNDVTEGIDETTEHLSVNVDRNVLRQLYRGYWPIADEIDLHGLRSNEAFHALQHFFKATQGKRCLLIVHGKGYGSANQLPVLAIRLKRWLKVHPQVLAYRQAPPNQGGSGALLVLVKS